MCPSIDDGTQELAGERVSRRSGDIRIKIAPLMYMPRAKVVVKSPSMLDIVRVTAMKYNIAFKMLTATFCY